MNPLFAERKGLFNIASNVLNITDDSIKIDWESLSLDRSTPNWEIHPILWYGIDKGLIPQPPEQTIKKLRETYLVIKATVTLQDLLLEEILHKAEHKGIKVCLLKGIRLARDYYPDIGLRPTGDLDILVRPHSIRGMEEIFKEMGALFESSQKAHKRYIFPQANETVVEIHHRLINTKSMLQRIFFPSDFLQTLPWDEMRATEKGYLNLPIWFEYSYLHLHALKEGYKSLKWIIDIKLMDAVEKTDKGHVYCRFISNAKAMTCDISALLLGKKSRSEKRGLLWEKAVLAGAVGNAGRRERLLMATACSITV